MATSHKKLAAKKIPIDSKVVMPLSPLSVNTVRGRLGLSRKLFSRLTAFSERATADWESGKPVSEPGLRRVEELDRLRERLSEVFKEEANCRLASDFAYHGWDKTYSQYFTAL